MTRLAAVGVLALTACGGAPPAQEAAAGPTTACAVIRGFLARIPTAAVDPDSGPAPAPGCAARMAGHRTPAWDALDSLSRWLQDAGWVIDLGRMADGPDGGSVTLSREGTRCVVEAAWDGGDDGDSTTLRSDTLTIAVTCTPSGSSEPR